MVRVWDDCGNCVLRYRAEVFLLVTPYVVLELTCVILLFVALHYNVCEYRWSVYLSICTL